MLYRSLIAISSSSCSINIVVTAFDYANERGREREENIHSYTQKANLPQHA